MRKHHRKRRKIGSYQGITFNLNSGEEGHDPHIHAVLGAADWRLFLRDDTYEVKHGDFHQQEKRKMWRGYEQLKAEFVARWNEEYPDEPV